MADQSRGTRNNTRVNVREKPMDQKDLVAHVRQLERQLGQIERAIQQVLQARGEGGIEIKWPSVSLDEKRMRVGGSSGGAERTYRVIENGAGVLRTFITVQ